MNRFVFAGPAALLSACLFLLCLPGANAGLFLFAHETGRVLPGAFWRLVSLFGEWPLVLSWSLLACAWRSDRLPVVAGAAALAVLATVLLKAGFAVPRPPLVLPQGSVQLLDRLPGNGSFPSGHASAAGFGGALLAWCVPRARAGIVVAVLLVCVSRLAIGVHWPADLLGGVTLGWASLLLARACLVQAAPVHAARWLCACVLATVAGAVWVFDPAGEGMAGVLQPAAMLLAAGLVLLRCKQGR